ncbi:LOW QUALITY PROTEIN: lycopene beta cyclase, chloroplastic [Phalaenopsis equestris]|uniref:LOW QUALITY PROTEIN: lycopene beta cyclase, chloroplastic n=1 Tax=Phalaenopsis equestris TaxID=78828 RepID=UPI0009E5A94B|nr:LOW QUALITY PROTEIN: lycopene beta cyclase, chloroplastic [Phalaenopsis equestris]
MDTLLRIPKPQVPTFIPFLNKTPHPRWPRTPISPSTTAAATATTASTASFLELVPKTKKETLDFDLPRYDATNRPTIDPIALAVVGGGPAGLAVAKRVSEACLSVCSIDPFPNLVWPNNYGVWVDEFAAMDLLDCLDASWSSAFVYIDNSTTNCKLLSRPYARVDRRRLKSRMLGSCISNGVRFHQSKVLNVVHEESRSLLFCSDGTIIPAAVVLDATGFSRCLIRYDKPYNPGYQVAYGILAEVEEHPFELDRMVFMDWRDSHLKFRSDLKRRNDALPTFLYAMPFSSDRIFLEETSLVARPGIPIEDIQERMVERLRHLGIKIKRIEEDERCVIPMGGPLPVLPQRVLGIGGTAGMVHPSTGYMVARTLAAAPIVADAIVRYIGGSGEEVSARVWKDLWPIERRRQREFFCFGMDVLLRLDLEGTRRFFDAFFGLEARYWHGFLSSRLFLPELLVFGFSLFGQASNASRLEIMAKGTGPLVKMVNNLLKDREH